MVDTQLETELAALNKSELLEYALTVSYLLERYEKLMALIPECPEHGACIPHAMDWIEAAKAQLSNTVLVMPTSHPAIVALDPIPLEYQLPPITDNPRHAQVISMTDVDSALLQTGYPVNMTTEGSDSLLLTMYGRDALDVNEKFMQDGD